MAERTRGPNFDLPTRTILEKNFNKGMNGTGKKNKNKIEQCAAEARLTPTQVEVSYGIHCCVL